MGKERNNNRGRGKSRKADLKLRAKGRTIPGTHVPVLAEKVLTTLKPQPGEIVVDCTLGYGAHAVAFGKRIGTNGRLIGLDMDGDELAKTQRRIGKGGARKSFHHTNFSKIAEVLKSEQLDGCDIIFADLGVSSMQVDNADRGISYKSDGPLDMRMDKRLAATGADLLITLSEEELSKALWELSDEPDHATIAEWIVNQRCITAITQVSQLVRLVFNVKGMTERTWQKKQKTARFGSLHPAARTFQALRIVVNDEMGSLRKLLEVAPSCLRAGGRIGIISFQSGEDRLVKQAFDQGYSSGSYETISKDAIRPRTKEVITNPRCSSARFRWGKIHS
ncbi:MAG: 16S rRNA (cytosine(1402)-N(4))-methyltransferase RsmH [Planctomycetes bacterium]|nr:16S rRNA (cytosine(1402)-N(4))-methyltransferase RsmH [Planctomycetota bacterium]